MMWMFASTEYDLGTGKAAETLENSLTLASDTAKSWERVWDATIYPGDPLWKAMIGIAITIAAISLLYLALNQRKILENSSSWSELLHLMLPPLMVGLFLAGNGFLLSHTVVLMRDIGRGAVNNVYSAQIDGIILDSAIENLRSTHIANNRTRQIYAPCLKETGQKLDECMADPAKLEQLKKDTQQNTSDTTLTNLTSLANIFTTFLNPIVAAGAVTGQVAVEATQGMMQGKGATQIMAELAASPIISIVETVLLALQWGFVNALEGGLLFTALMAPIAVALSILPLAGKYFYAWLTGFFTLFGIQLGYAVLVGVIATVINFTGQEGQNLSYFISDMAFIIFASIVSPTLCITIAKGGGEALYQGISKAGVDVANGVVNTVSTVASTVSKFIIPL
jgi:hypothetical protein